MASAVPSLAEFFRSLWADYRVLAPRVSALRQQLEAAGETVVNDHVAFRTLDAGALSLETLGAHIESLGYRPFEKYTFEDKGLLAQAYLPPEPDEGGPAWPRVFLSGLQLDTVDRPIRAILDRIVASVRPAETAALSCLWSGVLWDRISYEDYLVIAEASEYAGWFAALGLRPNHFTVSVNALSELAPLGRLVDWVVAQGYSVNEAGGRIKGGPSVYLAQASTLADRLTVEFAEGRVAEIPTCYYEFAERFVTPEGTLYEGFVPNSANRLFESTDR